MAPVSRRSATIRGFIAGIALSSLSACASAPTPAVPVAPVLPPPSLDTKVARILRLEQQRIMRDEPIVEVPPELTDGATVESAMPPPVESASEVAAVPVLEFRHAMEPDLAALLTDTEAVVRARAATAIGRTGLAEGVELLQVALTDPDEGVRGSAAFGLGLLASREAVPALEAALADPSVLVRGRVVEALGLVGDRAAATAIVQAATGCQMLLANIAPDDEQWPKSPAIELCRLSLYALVRLQDYDALSQIALDGQGQPVSTWWPVAYALQRIGDRRALAPLRTLATASGTYSAGFALRGLTALEDPQLLPVARALAVNREADVKLRVAAVRLMARVGGDDDSAALVQLLSQEPSASPLAIETVTALGALGVRDAFDILVDLVSDRMPAMRAASLAAAARVDPEAFLLVLSGLPRDRDWSVRAALAGVLATLPAALVTPAVVDLQSDEDARVHGPALRALAELKVSDLAERLEVALQAEDFAERATAAELMAELKPAGGAGHLATAYTRGESDSTYVARLAAVEALATYGDGAIATLRQALSDREWPVRARAAALLRDLGVADAEPDRPAPLRWSPDFFESDALLHPTYSPHAFLETPRGIIELQLEVVDAPLTVSTFVDQVRSGLFNGVRVHRLVPAFVIQSGDPRGDGAGGPGYTQRDEFNSTPYLRGTVGMALAGPETGGSQWFITTSPQPHLDAKYTAFGRVVGGWDVLDRIAPGDVIERVRIWDGVELR